MLTPESLVHLQPDIIIEVVPGAGDRGIDPGALLLDWKGLDMLGAAAKGDVYVLTERYAAVPGPRFTLLLEEICSIVRRAAQKGDGAGRPPE
jgi:ABC-type Fe3+-hydroxamate transport system substrate-binding protein